MKTTRRAKLAVAVVLLAPLPVGAQDNPNFSGTWTQTTPSLAVDSSTHTEQIDQKGEQITVVVHKSGSAGPWGYASHLDHTYTINGPVESTRDPEGRVRSVAVSWDGPRLVFIRTAKEGANTIIEREAWSLIDDDTVLVKDRRTADWRGTRNEQIVLRRN